MPLYIPHAESGSLGVTLYTACGIVDSGILTLVTSGVPVELGDMELYSHGYRSR